MYNFVFLPNGAYLNNYFLLTENTAIDINQLFISIGQITTPEVVYSAVLDSNSVHNNIVIGFYNSYSPNLPLKVIGGEQQAISNFYEENGIIFFTVVISNKGFTIKFIRRDQNVLYCIDLA
jgi:hypothetical protein